MIESDDHKLDQILGVLETQGKLLEAQGRGLDLIQVALQQHATALSHVDDALPRINDTSQISSRP